jgi:hypothetical protein
MKSPKRGDLVRHKNSGMYFVVTRRWGWINNPDKPTYLKFAGEPNEEIFRAENYEVVCEETPIIS